MDSLFVPQSEYRFSPEAQRIYDGLLLRLLPNRMREGTNTNPHPDGKTPFLDTFESYPEEPYEVVLAHAIVRSWLETETRIYDGDILLGITRPPRPAVEHFSYGIENHWNEDLAADPAYAPRAKEIEERLRRLRPRMEPLSYDRHVADYGKELYPDGVYENMVDANLWWVGGYQGHTVPSYPMLLSLGVDGALRKIAHYKKVFEHDGKRQELYRAMTVLMEGFSEYILLWAEAAEKKAAGETGWDRENDLAAAAVCRAIAHRPPENLREAAQLMWFYCLWDWSDCIGRTDQYLLPFFRKTVREEGQEQAENIICALWFKILENGIHNMTLGGVLPETGEDAANELTVLLLRIGKTCHETHPRLSLRVHKDTPKALLRLGVSMWADGMSDPSVVSDENVIPALQEYGVKLRDARDYTILGCQEIELPGKSNFGCEDGSFNLAKVFEYTINDGRDRFTGRQIGLHTGCLTDYSSAEALWDAYIRQLNTLIPNYLELCNRGVEVRNKNCAKLVKSVFTEACVERGRNLDDGGAVYNYGVIETAGSSAVGDAFAAIEKLVFEDHALTMAEVQNAINRNFEGCEDVRLLLRRAPKFGNDLDAADKWCVRVLEYFWTEIGKYRSVRGDVFTGACSLLEGGIAYGKNTWAMPDGRRAGEPLGNTIGPREGNDTCGPTAMLRSVMKLPLKKGIGGTTLNLLLPRSLMSTPEGIERNTDLIYTYLMCGGQMAQITTPDVEELREAQRCPAEHGNVIVRVGGFSIAFVELDKDTQNEIISRYAT